MADGGITRIVFSDGAKVEVDEQLAEVRRLLDKYRASKAGTGLSRFTAHGTDADVFVAPERVAYIERVPEPGPPGSMKSPLG